MWSTQGMSQPAPYGIRAPQHRKAGTEGVGAGTCTDGFASALFRLVDFGLVTFNRAFEDMFFLESVCACLCRADADESVMSLARFAYRKKASLPRVASLGRTALHVLQTTAKSAHCTRRYSLTGN